MTPRERVVSVIRHEKPDRIPIHGWVRSNLARVHAGAEVLKLMNWKQAYHFSEGRVSPAQSSAVKVFGSELYMDAYRALLEITGSRGAIAAGSEAALLNGKLERLYRALMVLTFGGGTNEVQRDIIAQAGLRMPRAG